MATAVAAAAPASAGAAAAREKPVSKTGDAGCVGRSTEWVGGIGRAVGGALLGPAGGAVAKGVAGGKPGCHEGLKARPRQGWRTVLRW